MGNDLRSGDNSIRDLAVGGILLGGTVFATSIDGDLDCDCTTTDLFALESFDGLLLFSLVTNVDEAISLALSGFAPPPSNDASRIDFEAGIGEESGKAGVVDVETEVGNEENGLGGFADGVLTGGARRAESPGPAVSRPVSTFCGRISWRGVCSRSGGLSFSRPGPVTALKVRSGQLRRGASNGAYVELLLLPGPLRSFGSRSGFSLVGCLTIRLSVGDFSRDRLGTSSARGPLLGLPRPVFRVLFCRWSSDLDDYRATLKLFLVQSLYSLLGGLDGGESNETIPNGTSAMTRPALNDMSADAVD